jgi:O-antigen/teichoic acid export membrane protein
MLIVNGVLAAAGAALFGLVGAAASTTITYALAAFALVAICARSLDVPMRDLAVPRVSDLLSYWRAVRSLAGRLRSAPAIAPK